MHANLHIVSERQQDLFVAFNVENNRISCSNVEIVKLGIRLSHDWMDWISPVLYVNLMNEFELNLESKFVCNNHRRDLLLEKFSEFFSHFQAFALSLYIEIEPLYSQL